MRGFEKRWPARKPLLLDTTSGKRQKDTVAKFYYISESRREFRKYNFLNYFGFINVGIVSNFFQ